MMYSATDPLPWIRVDFRGLLLCSIRSTAYRLCEQFRVFSLSVVNIDILI